MKRIACPVVSLCSHLKKLETQRNSFVFFQTTRSSWPCPLDKLDYSLPIMLHCTHYVAYSFTYLLGLLTFQSAVWYRILDPPLFTSTFCPVRHRATIWIVAVKLHDKNLVKFSGNSHSYPELTLVTIIVIFSQYGRIWLLYASISIRNCP